MVMLILLAAAGAVVLLTAAVLFRFRWEIRHQLVVDVERRALAVLERQRLAADAELARIANQTLLAIDGETDDGNKWAGYTWRDLFSGTSDLGDAPQEQRVTIRQHLGPYDRQVEP